MREDEVGAQGKIMNNEAELIRETKLAAKSKVIFLPQKNGPSSPTLNSLIKAHLLSSRLACNDLVMARWVETVLHEISILKYTTMH